MWQSILQVQANHEGVTHRRGFLRNLTAGLGLGVFGWQQALMAQADELRHRDLACILLFMRGGPSQFETFDPKPGHVNGGPTQAIATSVEGVRLAEGWTNLAREMREVALIRSMTNREGEHQRAVYQMHTGYVPMGGVRFPSLGSVVASEIAPRDFDLPHFVSVSPRIFTFGSGFLGMQFAPFIVPNPSEMPANVSLPVQEGRFDRRLQLMQDLEQDFSEAGGSARVRDHQALAQGAASLVRSPRLQAFDLSRETDATRDRYGRTSFGQGCLLARRLVETGVTFVEVDLNGWDTHVNNFDACRRLSEQADKGFASLVRDLRERGRLDRTLVICMGEFGRTPRINANNGRDHYPRAFSLALAGAGIQGGRVVGATSDGGVEVTQRPVSVADLFCTFCQSLGINPRKENQSPQGRPIKIVDGGESVRELLTA